jgi:uncharacterized protein involved in outer membrane biogenesis
MIRKIALITAVGIVVLLLAAAIGVYWLFSGDGMRLALESQATLRLGQPVRIGGARGQLFPRIGIRLRDVRIGEPARVTLAGVQLSTDLRALLNRRIEDARVVVSDSRLEVPILLGILAAGGQQGKPSSTSQPAVRFVSIREIALRNIRVISRGREIVVSADSTLDGDTLAVRRFSAQSGGTSLDVSGKVDLEPRIDAQLKATANKIDVDELLALAAAFTPAGAPASRKQASKPARIAARIASKTAKVGDIEVTQFSTGMEVDGNRVALTPIAFQIFGGRYEGSLNARLGERLTATLQSRVEDVDVAQLAAFGGSPDTVTGRLTATGTFGSQGADMEAIMASASGKGTAAIVDGSIRRLDLVRTVVLFFGKPAADSPAASDRFERFDASFSLANQVFRADSLSLRSRDADLTGTGTLTLGNEALDGRVNMILSEELTSQAGTDLVRYTREGNRVVLPARVSGTLAKPRVTIDASAAIKRGLINEGSRRLLELFGK